MFASPGKEKKDLVRMVNGLYKLISFSLGTVYLAFFENIFPLFNIK